MSEHAIVIGLYLLTGGMKDEHHVSRISHPSMHGVYGWLTGNLSVRIDEWRHDLVCFGFRYDMFLYHLNTKYKFPMSLASMIKFHLPLIPTDNIPKLSLGLLRLPLSYFFHPSF